MFSSMVAQFRKKPEADPADEMREAENDLALFVINEASNGTAIDRFADAVRNAPC